MTIQIRFIGILPRCHGVSMARTQALPTMLLRSFSSQCSSNPTPHPSMPALPSRLRLGLLWKSGSGHGIIRSVERRAFSSAQAREAAKGASAPATASPAKQPARLVYPQKMLIYHAGTGKTTFLAMLKLTTIFVFVFFTFLVAPSYIMAAAPLETTAGILLCGIVPIVYVTYSASPFVTAVHLHLPPFARTSAEMLRRFVANATPATKLDIVSQSFIGKPRVSTMTVGELKPCKKRWGMVNYERDTAAANEERKWYHWRAIGNFNIQQGNEGKTKHGWVWTEIARTIQKRNEVKF